MLGFWDEACHSFEEAQKIDFDEDILMLLKEIKPKVFYYAIVNLLRYAQYTFVCLQGRTKFVIWPK